MRLNQRRHYTGQSRWEYRLPDGRHGIVHNAVPSNNYNEDERFAIDFTLMTGEVARLLDDLLAALGGEAKSAA